MPEGTMNSPSCSIYEYIKKNTKDGRLPEGFSIPWINNSFAPGAQDGLFLKHMAPIEFQPDEDRDRKILDALKLMSIENNSVYIDEIMSIFEEIEKKTTIVRLFDKITDTIISHQEELNLENILRFGDFLISFGTSRFAVKLGLNLLAPFNALFVEEVAIEFGVYDEFTYYAARILSLDTWKKGNEELFSLAKNIKGWGRIHAVDYLRPDTQEIKDWLLYEGANNVIDPQYSADICLQKAEARKRLDGDLTAREYEAIGNLIQQAL